MKPLFQVIYVVVTGCYSGCFPKAPGTAGTIMGSFFWIVSENLGFLQYFSSRAIVTITVILVGWWSTASYLKLLQNQGKSFDENFLYSKTIKQKIDPQEVVIDEWAGLCVGLTLIPAGSLVTFITVVLFFRVFDIFKWGPIKKAENLPGSLGIMADDIVAGLGAGGVTYALAVFVENL
jgi:phosphatidylglycerophosphatase A